jgi:hypothetical protein
VQSLERLVLRTGPVRREPTIDTPVDAAHDLPDHENPIAESSFDLKSLHLSMVSPANGADPVS